MLIFQSPHGELMVTRLSPSVVADTIDVLKVEVCICHTKDALAEEKAAAKIYFHAHQTPPRLFKNLI